MNTETLASSTTESLADTGRPSCQLYVDQKDKPGTLRDSVDQSLARYFGQLDGLEVRDIYNMVLSEVEAPLMEQTLRFTRNNQTRAAEILGLNRGTLRKKLKQYGLL
ncbi:DNA-binding transcriptional regulator Fis [Allohahella sp. A8]|uniref:DNA-binding transcriptional regulator Fis n=1 Tax=Allohahella sp. A8 TaxID=3141461 RepID=UPI000C0A7776|nr:DNA-binding transcriptional regulator Fis [Hahellaceae bacterium]